MVDFGELKDKAEAFAAEHASQIKQGIGKAGDLVGSRIGHDKVDPIEQKLGGFLDGLGKDKDAPAETGTATPPVTPPVTPPAATPPVTPPAV
jgi:hypothetical protein